MHTHIKQKIGGNFGFWISQKKRKRKLFRNQLTEMHCHEFFFGFIATPNAFWLNFFRISLVFNCPTDDWR